MENNKLDFQRHATSVFDWLPISFAVCRLGSERYPDIYRNFDCSRNNFHEGCSGIEIFLLKHTEDRV